MDMEDDFMGLDKNSELYKLLKMLHEQENEYDEELEKIRELASDVDNLGEPHKIETYEEDNLTITVKYWYVPGGEIKNVDIEGDDSLVSEEDLQDKVAKIISDNKGANVVGVDINNSSTLNKSKIKAHQLGAFLEETVKNEDYVLASRIRDDIKTRDTQLESLISNINTMIRDGEFEIVETLLKEVKDLKFKTYEY
jgi:hypothetical protein